MIRPVPFVQRATLALLTPLLEKNVLKTASLDVPMVFSMSRVIVLSFAVAMLRQVWKAGIAGWPDATLAIATVLALPITPVHETGRAVAATIRAMEHEMKVDRLASYAMAMRVDTVRMQTPVIDSISHNDLRQEPYTVSADIERSAFKLAIRRLGLGACFEMNGGSSWGLFVVSGIRIRLLPRQPGPIRNLLPV